MPKKLLDIFVPADVPKEMHKEYISNYQAITRNTENVMLFACDQKIEHLNQSFVSPDIDQEILNPEHLFYIASHGTISAMATQLGLVARYGLHYNNINYIIKLNSKTDIITPIEKDPRSEQLWSVYDVITLKKQTGLSIRGIGYTLYMGSEFEWIMIKEAAQAIFQAHQNGLIAILWIYTEGRQVTDDQDPMIIISAAGVATALGSDFAILKAPRNTYDKTGDEWLALAGQAAGNTKLICSGGSKTDPEDFLKELHEQIHIGKNHGSATGRNIFQRSRKEAIAFTKAISAVVLDNKSIDQALEIFNNHA